MKQLFAAVGSSLVFGHVCLAAPATGASTLSVNQTLIRYFDQKYPDLKNNPAITDRVKIEAANSDPDIMRQMRDLEKKFGAKPVYSDSEIEKIPSVGKEESSPLPVFWGQPLGGLRIRDTYQAMDLATPLTEPTKAKAALFSFANNFLDDTAVWTAQGAVILPREVETELPHLPAFLAVGSIAFNRVSGGSAANQVDSLVFRGGADFEIGSIRIYRNEQDKGADEFLNLSIRPDFAYSTDFSFESSVFAGEIDIEPTIIGWGLGAFNPFLVKDSWVQYRLRFFGHLEAGGVDEAGEISSLKSAQPLLRMGFFVQGELRPSPQVFRDNWIRNFSAMARYEFYPSLTDAPTVSLLTANLSYSFGTHLSLEFQYQNGRIPLSAQRIDLFTIGLGLKL